MRVFKPDESQTDLKTFQRAAQIVRVLMKYGLEDLFDHARTAVYLSDRKGGSEDEREEGNGRSRPERVRQAFEELGPTFMKLGQILATRPDLLPAEYTSEFRKLEDEAPPFDFKSIREQIASELGQELEDIFEDFDRKPLAAASLSQVHRARLKTGEIVAVKVQRPGIREEIQADFKVLAKVGELFREELVQEMQYDPRKVIRQFSDAVMEELNFMNEGRNIERFRENFADSPDVLAPRVFWDYTCTSVLTMEYVEGAKISKVFLEDRKGYDRERIAEIGAEAVLKQVLEDGFFHADPHPGNLLIVGREKVCFLDFGRMGYVDEKTSLNILNLLEGIFDKDTDSVSAALTRMGVIDEPSQTESVEPDIQRVLARYHGMTLREITTRELVTDLLDLMNRHRLSLPENLTLLLHTLMTIEGVSMELHPDFSMFKQAEPYVRRMAWRRLSPGGILRRLRKPVIKTVRLLETLPDDVELALSKFRRSDFSVGLRLRGLEELVEEIDVASNRLSVSLIISALIVGSSLVVQSNLGPSVWGYPLLGILGYGVASILGIGVVISILRGGRF